MNKIKDLTQNRAMRAFGEMRDDLINACSIFGRAIGESASAVREFHTDLDEIGAWDAIALRNRREARARRRSRASNVTAVKHGRQYRTRR